MSFGKCRGDADKVAFLPWMPRYRTLSNPMVRSNPSEHQKFVWNLVENIQRVDLSPKERVASILALAESGMGVREISRGTGKDPSTISRWLRVANKPAVVRAIEEERIGLGYAQYL